MLKPVNHANPKIFDKDYLFLKVLAKELQRAVAEIPGKELTILDVGTVYKPYSCLFKGKYLRYFTIDIPQPNLKDKPNIVALADYLPIASESVDVVLCTQVLEHVSDPTKILSELARVLKKGGTLLLSTHGVFHYHPYPHDYWRWTQEGLHKIIKEHFEDVKICPNGGATLLLFHIIGRGVFFLAERTRFFRFLRYTVYPLINITALIADKHLKSQSLSINYLAVAKK